MKLGQKAKWKKRIRRGGEKEEEQVQEKEEEVIVHIVYKVLHSFTSTLTIYNTIWEESTIVRKYLGVHEAYQLKRRYKMFWKEKYKFVFLSSVFIRSVCGKFVRKFSVE